MLGSKRFRVIGPGVGVDEGLGDADGLGEFSAALGETRTLGSHPEKRGKATTKPQTGLKMSDLRREVRMLSFININFIIIKEI